MNREDFPILKNNLIYFDNGATTLKPQSVFEGIKDYYEKYTASVHRGDYKNSNLVDKIYEDTRKKVQKLINAKSEREIVFTSGTTQSLNWIVDGYFKSKLAPGDEVIISESEHASNVLPWFHLQDEIGIKIKYVKLNENYEITRENLLEVISKKTKVISLAHVTNVIGDLRDLEMISKLAHEHNILLVIDAAQSIAHVNVDVQRYNIDFLAFSAHKMYGPTGIGVLYAKEELLEEFKPLLYGGGMNKIFYADGYMELNELPSRLEAGTPNIEGVIGFSKALDYIEMLQITTINKYEQELQQYLLKQLKELDFIKVYNKNTKGNIVIFNIQGVFSQDTAIYLDKYNICVRAGSHCAKILNNQLNISNTCRISLSFYNTKEEIDLLINVLKNSANIWKEIL